MRADEVLSFIAPEEQLTIPSLGGDGVVTVRCIGFGMKARIATTGDIETQAARLVAASVFDEAGTPVMSADAWNFYGAMHEDDFLTLLRAAKRVSGFDGGEVKKD